MFPLPQSAQVIYLRKSALCCSKVRRKRFGFRFQVIPGLCSYWEVPFILWFCVLFLVVQLDFSTFSQKPSEKRLLKLCFYCFEGSAVRASFLCSVPLTPQSFGARSANRDNIVTPCKGQFCYFLPAPQLCHHLRQRLLLQLLWLQGKEHIVPGLLGRVGMLLESSGLGKRGAREEVGHQWGCEDEGDLHRAAAQWDKSWSFLAVGIF